MNRSKLIRIWIRFHIGLVIYALGVYLSVKADIGVSAWDTLNFGLMNYIPLGYGTVSAMVNVVILIIDLLLHERFGFGTVFDAVCTGYYAQFFMWLDPVPGADTLAGKIGIYLAALAVMSVGVYYCLSSGQGCGPKDALMLGIGKRLKRLPVGASEILQQLAAAVAGYLLGGPVGIGTLLSVTIYGLIMQGAFDLYHYEPRDTEHMGFAPAIRILAGRTDTIS